MCSLVYCILENVVSATNHENLSFFTTNNKQRKLVKCSRVETHNGSAAVHNGSAAVYATFWQPSDPKRSLPRTFVVKSDHHLLQRPPRIGDKRGSHKHKYPFRVRSCYFCSTSVPFSRRQFFWLKKLCGSHWPRKSNSRKLSYVNFPVYSSLCSLP